MRLPKLVSPFSHCLKHSISSFPLPCYFSNCKWLFLVKGLHGSGLDFSNWCNEKQLDQALQFVELREQQGILLSKDTLLCLLQGCAKHRDLIATRRVHNLMISSGLDSVGLLGDHLIRLFAFCGSLLEVNQTFCRVRTPSVYTWNGIIAAHVKLGEGERAIELYDEMQHEGIRPDKVLFLSILKGCASTGVVSQGRLIHAQIISGGLESDAFLGSTLIDMYAKCGSLSDAHKVFDKLSSRNMVSWSALIAGCFQNGLGPHAVELFETMQQEGIKPDNFMFSCILKACCNANDIDLGKQIHNEVINYRLESDIAVGNALVDMYGKCGSLEVAREVFNQMPIRNVVSWGAMMTGYTQHGHGFSTLDLFEKMQQEGFKSERVIFLCILKACGGIGLPGWGRLIHDEIIRSGLDSDITIGNTIVDMYAKVGSLEEAHKMFDMLQNRNVVSWGAMIAGFSQHGHGAYALEIFDRMQVECIKPDDVMFSSILKACGSVMAIQQGRLIHDQIFRSALQLDVFIGNTLVDMYSRCCSLEEARKVFDSLQNRNVVSWGAMIAGYTQQGRGSLALSLFEKMQEGGILPDTAIFLCALKACSSIGAIDKGKLVHKHILESGLSSDLVLGNTLVDMYAKCGNLEEALNVFNELVVHDVVSWGAIIAGYSQHGNGLYVLEFFDKMQKEGITPNEIIFTCSLKACGNMGSILQGRLIHEQVIRSGREADTVIGNSLIDMYAECGSLKEACTVFDNMSKRDLVSWSTIIAVYAECGHCWLALQYFEEMQLQGLKPSSVIFISILAACSHSGLLEEGHHLFKLMTEDYCITPSIEHYNCMINLLGRAGRLNEAKNFIETMPIPLELIGWTSLLSSCKTYGDVELGKYCFDQIVQLDPNNASGLVLMSNIYADADMWEDVNLLQDFQGNTRLLKKPGMAWIELMENVQEFIVGGNELPESNDIYCKVAKVGRTLKDEGHVPQLDLVLKEHVASYLYEWKEKSASTMAVKSNGNRQ